MSQTTTGGKSGKTRNNKVSPSAIGATSLAVALTPPPTNPAPAAPEPFVLYVRGLKDPANSARKFTDPGVTKALKAALAWTGLIAPEPVMYWKGIDGLAVVDADWHYTDDDGNPVSRLDDRQAAAIAQAVEPMPERWWRTHGGGLRLVYAKNDLLTAGELAALAIYSISLACNRSGFLYGIKARGPSGIEIKSETRHPLYPKADGSTCGQIRITGSMWGPQRVAGKLLGTADGVEEEAVDEYLEGNDRERGRAYPHDSCPIEPSHGSHGTPVWVGDHGINCLSCQAHGKTLPGASTPGFAPWMLLIDPDGVRRKVNILRNAVRNFAHWPHVLHLMHHVLNRPDAPEKTLRLIYRALLKLHHIGRLDLTKPENRAKVEPIEVLIEKVFFPEVPIVRMDGAWVWAGDMGRVVDKEGEKLVEGLPAVQYVKVTATGRTLDDGAPEYATEVKQDRRKLALLKSNGDLSEFGYAQLDPILGVDLAGVIGSELDGKTIPALVPIDPPFKYRPKAERGLLIVRIPYEFPGVNFKLLKLLIAAKLYAQLGGSEPPRILIVGMSQSAKTAHVRLAAEMTGDNVTMLGINESVERFKRGFGELSRASSYILSDEIAKSDLDGKRMCELLLSVTSDTMFHQLYKGHRRIGRLPVHVLVDTLVPEGLFADVQVTRRTVFVDLGAGIQTDVKPVDWRTTCSTGEIRGWRKASWSGADSADALVSEVRDEAQEFGTFEGYAEHLGFPLLRDTDQGVDPDAGARAFFREVLDHPDTTDNARFRGRGWKVFDKDGAEPIAAAWRELVGPSNDLQAATGRQWGRIVEVAGLTCGVSTHGKKVGVRFLVGDPRSPSARFGRDVLPDGHPLLAERESPADVLTFPLPVEAGSAVTTKGSGQPVTGS